MQKFWQGKSVVVFSVSGLNSQATCGYSLMVNLPNFLSRYLESHRKENSEKSLSLVICTRMVICKEWLLM